MADYHTADGEPNHRDTTTPEVIHARDIDGEGPSLETGTALIAVDYGSGAYCGELSSGEVRELAAVLIRGRNAIGREELPDSVERKVKDLIRTLENANDGAPREEHSP